MVFVKNAVLIPLKTVVLTRGTMIMAVKKLLSAAYIMVFMVFPIVFFIFGRSSAIPDGCFWSSSPLASWLIQVKSENAPADSMDHLQSKRKCSI
jgi:hypothetical protein